MPLEIPDLHSLAELEEVGSQDTQEDSPDILPLGTAVGLGNTESEAAQLAGLGEGLQVLLGLGEEMTLDNPGDTVVDQATHMEGHWQLGEHLGVGAVDRSHKGLMWEH